MKKNEIFSEASPDGWHFSFEKIKLTGKNNEIITRGRKIVEQVQPSQNKSWSEKNNNIINQHLRKYVFSSN